MRTDLGRLLKHSGIYAIGSVLNAVGAFLLLPLYTRYLAPSEYGALELLYAASAVMMGVLSVGIGHATLRFYFEYTDDADRRAVVATNLWAATGLAFFGIILAAVWHGELVHYFFGDERYAHALLLVLISVLFELSAQVGLAYIRAREYSLLFISTALMRLLLQIAANSYFVAVKGYGIDGIVLGNLLAVILSWSLVSFVAVRECGLRFQAAKLREILHYSSPFLLSTVCALISTQVDKFFINSFLTLQALGIYALATKFSAALSAFVAEPFNRAYGAFRFSVMKNPDAAAIQATTVRYVTFLALTLAVVIGLFAGDVLHLMSNSGFWPAAQLVPVLMFAAVLNTMVYPLQTGILYQKKSQLIFYISVIAAVVSAATNFFLIPRFGVNGAALAQVITAFSAATATAVWSQRYFRVDYDVGKLVTLFVFAALILFLGQWAISALPWALSFVLRGALGVTFVVSVFFSGFIPADERVRLLARFRAAPMAR